MLVKFFKQKANSSVTKSIDYLCGLHRDRLGARVLAGHVGLTEAIAKQLDFNHRYTAGCLSFEENDIAEEHKTAIMRRFEATFFAGLEKSQYNISWIEHRDKGRLELNFVVPNVELSTGKRLLVYYDGSDRGLADSFKRVINYEYGLSDPDDPSKKQMMALDVHKCPINAIELKKAIGVCISTQIENNALTSQSEVINELKRAGFEISRVTDTSISIKNPEAGGRNIRLKGLIYENRRFSREFAKEYQAELRSYKCGADERYQSSGKELEERTRYRAEQFAKKFKQKDMDRIDIWHVAKLDYHHGYDFTVSNENNGLENGRDSHYSARNIKAKNAVRANESNDTKAIEVNDPKEEKVNANGFKQSIPREHRAIVARVRTRKHRIERRERAVEQRERTFSGGITRYQSFCRGIAETIERIREQVSRFNARLQELMGVAQQLERGVQKIDKALVKTRSRDYDIGGMSR